MVQEVQRLMQEHYKLGKEVKMAEVRALQAQIQPHFLYNTLDLINWISMDYGAEEIGTLTWNLARFYRLSLNHGKSLITIGEEVEHVQVYVNIDNYHFDNQISLNVDVPEELKASPASTSFYSPLWKMRLSMALRNTAKSKAAASQSGHGKRKRILSLPYRMTARA